MKFNSMKTNLSFILVAICLTFASSDSVAQETKAETLSGVVESVDGNKITVNHRRKSRTFTLYDVSKDVSEKNDLRTELPEVYATLKKELIDHLSNINSEYPGGGSFEAGNSRKPKAEDTTETPTTKRPSRDQFFRSRDRNKDGAITLEELIGNPKGRNVPALTKRFKQLDANSDGTPTLKELKNAE